MASQLYPEVYGPFCQPKLTTGISISMLLYSLYHGYPMFISDTSTIVVKSIFRFDKVSGTIFCMNYKIVHLSFTMILKIHSFLRIIE